MNLDFLDLIYYKKITCEYCGFIMQFLKERLKLANFNYKCPICQTKISEILLKPE